MSFKKLIVTIQSLSIVIPSVFLTVSCSIGVFDSRNFLENLKDYDWVKDSSGDRLEYNFQSEDYIANNSNMVEINNITNGPIDKIFNYSDYSTGYKTARNIQKQGTTGSPVAKAFRPNGNTWADFGISAKSRNYERFNTITEWNAGDLDQKYFVGKEELRSRNFAASKSTENQQTQTFYNRIHDKEYSDSSIVGTKRPFSQSMVDFAYVNYYEAWGGFENLGWINPVTPDMSDKLHKNGVPALGLIYLSGWEDVSKDKIKELFNKDSQGNYIFVDILIEMALKYNFDGWFFNNEANGGHAEGANLDESEVNQILKQFNEKTEKLEKQTGKKITMVYYKNESTLRYSGNSAENKQTTNSIDDSTLGFGSSTRNRMDFQLDFSRQFPGDEEEFLSRRDLGETFKSRISSLYNEEINAYAVGTYDFRKYIYNFTNKVGDGKTEFEYDYSNATNSLNSFSPGADINYGNDYYNFLTSTKDNSDPNQVMYNWIMAQEVSNMYNTYQYAGINGYLKNDAKGYDTPMIAQNNTDNEAIYKYLLQQKKVDTRYNFDGLSITDIVNLNPRVKYSEKTVPKVKETETIFKYNDNGEYTYSYGLGNLFQEQTVLTDTQYNKYDLTETPVEKPNIKTNFTTGSGIKFISRDSQGNIVENYNNYPWTNGRLSDLLPTYQFDFWKVNSSNNTIKEENTPDGEKNRLKITEYGQLNGYYDYFNPYQKGNSIGIGNGYDFDKNGQLMDGIWEKNQDYRLNLMGTNLQTNDYTVEFIVKASSTNDELQKSDFSDIAKNSKVMVMSSNSTQPIVLNSSSVTDMKNGWYKISADLSNNLGGINSKNRISKIGLQINSKDHDSFIYNIGEFSLLNNDLITDYNSNGKITSATNEYIVKREDVTGKYENNSNIRFNWQTENENFVDYYIIYYFYDNKWFRIGETTSKEYYLHSLPSGDNMKIGIKPVNQSGNSKNMFVATFNSKN